jgi:serine/threonine-protein kinase
MAPELITGETIPRDQVPRLDVYSLGVIAYELLTGMLPFDSDDVSETLRMQVKAPPPRLLTQREDLPAAFEEAVLAALTKDPRKRTPSAEVLRLALEAAWHSQKRPADTLFFLVADDDPGFRTLLRATLQKAFREARVESVPDGKAALALARSRTPDLIVSDLDMPQMNGIELTAAIRSEHTTSEVPIVVATAVGGARDWQVLSQLGADSFIMKPFDPLHLISLVENLLGRKATWKPDPKRRAPPEV